MDRHWLALTLEMKSGSSVTGLSALYLWSYAQLVSDCVHIGEGLWDQKHTMIRFSSFDFVCRRKQTGPLWFLGAFVWLQSSMVVPVLVWTNTCLWARS